MQGMVLSVIDTGYFSLIYLTSIPLFSSPDHLNVYWNDAKKSDNYKFCLQFPEKILECNLSNYALVDVEYEKDVMPIA